MNITVLDAETLGGDVCMTTLEEAGTLTLWLRTRNIPERIREAQVIVTNKERLNAENLPYAKNLKLICVTATGYDNIDLPYCQSHGIAVCNVPGYSTDSVAQTTLAMVLRLSTRLSEYEDHVKTGAYSRGGSKNFLGFPWSELSGKTWGILGGGAIGQKVAQVAEALGCHILMYRRSTDPHFEMADVDRICREADVISVHLPLSPETKQLLNRERIAEMKPSVIVVNTSRGAVTDEKALADAILEHRIGALGADVYAQEPFPETHPFAELRDFPNVCLTPHMAWSAIEARNRCVKITAENIRAFAEGRRQNRIV